jgi:hypothetical protein
MISYSYFSRGRRKRGVIVQTRCTTTKRLLSAEELVLGMSKLPIMTPARPLPAGSTILALPEVLAELGDKVTVTDAIIPRISRSRPGTAAGGSAEAEAVAGRKPPH